MCPGHPGLTFLLIGCGEPLASFRRWIAATWARIVGSGDPKHQQAGTGVDLIRTYGGVMAYVTSYISKDDQTLPGNFTGRYWGVMNRVHLPVAPRKVKVWNNSGGALLCNASGFWAAVQRGMQQGLL